MFGRAKNDQRHDAWDIAVTENFEMNALLNFSKWSDLSIGIMLLYPSQSSVKLILDGFKTLNVNGFKVQ